MRISDWSSDVCSSDLMRFGPSGADRLLAAPGRSQSPPTPTPGEAHAGWGRSRRTAMRQTGKRRARREDGGAKPPAPRTNLYDDVTHRIVAELEAGRFRSEEHTSELQSLMRHSYAVFCSQKKHHHTH